MSRRIATHFAILISFIFCPPPVGAETIVAPSIEWLACVSKVVAVGNLTEVRESKGPGEVIYEDCTLRVTELLKSAGQQAEVTFTYRRFNRLPSLSEWMGDGTQFLVFLSGAKDDGLEQRLSGALVPTSMSFPLSVVNLSSPGKYLFTMKFDVLDEGSEVLRAVRDGVRALNNYQLDEKDKHVEEVRVEVPFGSEAHIALYAGSACYLVVPNFMIKQGERERR
jgi:hypothetical protein